MTPLGGALNEGQLWAVCRIGMPYMDLPVHKHGHANEKRERVEGGVGGALLSPRPR